MKVQVPIIIKDRETSAGWGLDFTHSVKLDEEFLLAGPVGQRVAVLDFDPRSGVLRPGVEVVDAGPDGVACYRIADAQDPAAADLMAVSVWGTVLQTMAMFEEADALGRPVAWAFDGQQLFVVPDAGQQANAYYERESRSLQFFGWDLEDGRRIRTCQSQDIVAHETAHAVLDGIAPHLYHAISPQALALHESVADLAALLQALRCRPLAEAVLERTGGSIQQATAFSSVAEEFGDALYGRGALRDLLNNCTLWPDAGDADHVDRHEPHDLSRVLSGTLYVVLIQLHETLKSEFAEKRYAAPRVVSRAEQRAALPADVAAPSAPQGLAGLAPAERAEARRRVAAKALAVAAERFKRMLIRGLDYLPPGDVSFADFGRAMLAADEAAHPFASAQREWLRSEMVRRGIVHTEQELDVQTSFELDALADIDLDELVHSDWVAYGFVSSHLDLFGIPQRTPFVVHPRLDVRKRYYEGTADHETDGAGGEDDREDGITERRECILKVSWSVVEENRVAGLPDYRQITVGVTMAIDWERRVVRALLSTDRSGARQADRDAMVRKLFADDDVRIGAHAEAPDGGPLVGAVRAEKVNGVLRLRGTARMLHLTRRT